jgi:hypothetical protein
MSQSVLKRAPLWPLLLAPIIGIVYYFALKLAFVMSLDSAVGEVGPGASEVGLGGFSQGPHWIYRAFGELCSVCLAAYLAAGLARGRSAAAGIIAGCTISLFPLSLGIYFAVARQASLWDILAANPWYQSCIDSLVIVGSPYVGFKASEIARDVVRANPVGFDGVNRLHLLWLWIAVLCYGIGLIGPFVRTYSRQWSFGPDGAGELVVTLITTMPLFIPAYYGLGLLSRRTGAGLNPVARNALGVLVLVVGFAVGAAMQHGWYLLYHWLFGN